MQFNLFSKGLPIHKKSGIYKINNSITGNFYIGSAVDLGKRMEFHRNNLINKKHHNWILIRVFERVGKDNLSVDILEECSRESLIEREQYYIDTLNPKYNICRKAKSLLGFKFSEESKRKMSIAGKGKKKPTGFGDKVSARFKGVPKSKESIEKRKETVRKKIENGWRQTKTATDKVIAHCTRISHLQKRIENLPRGKDNMQTKLTENEVLEIRKLYRAGVRINDINRQFANVGRKSISSIVNNKTWKWLKD